MRDTQVLAISKMGANSFYLFNIGFREIVLWRGTICFDPQVPLLYFRVIKDRSLKDHTHRPIFTKSAAESMVESANSTAESTDSTTYSVIVNLLFLYSDLLFLYSEATGIG